jgi:hypothetical protein
MPVRPWREAMSQCALLVSGAWTLPRPHA